MTIFYSSENEGHHQIVAFFAAVCANENYIWGIETQLKVNALPLNTTWVRNLNSKRLH